MVRPCSAHGSVRTNAWPRCGERPIPGGGTRDRLVRRRVDAEARDPERELQVGDVLEATRGVAPRPVERSHRLRAGERLAVYVRDGGCALQVGDVGRVRVRSAGVEHPHRAHRHVGVAAHRQVVPELRPVVLERLCVVGEAAGVRLLFDRSVVLACEQVGDGPSVVPQEAVGLRDASPTT